MVKIAHIANPAAGVGVYLEQLVKHTNTKKFDHLVLHNPKESANDFHFKKTYVIPLRRQINFIEDVKCLFRIVKTLKSIKPDNIHCHSAKAGVLGRIAGSYLRIPTFYTPHAYSYLSAESKFKSRYYKLIEKLFRFVNSKTIACSESEYLRTINDLKFKKNKVFLWKNSIEDNFSIDPSEIRLKLPNEFLCSVGRPSYQKNTKLLVNTILEVKKVIKDIKMVILGVGFYSPQLEEINSLINKYDLKDNIILVPWLKRKEVINIISKSKLYVSTSRYEGLPYTILEAMALSKPCVVTNVDGNKDLIQNGFNGLLVKEDAELLAEAIIDLISNNDRLKNMSENTRMVFLENYNIKNSILDLENIYLSEILVK